ncbi:hypothetical protein Tco_1524519 [Tanacetum coccineum]
MNSEVKGTSSSSTNTQNVAFMSSNSTNSTNGAVNTAHGATTVSTQATAINSTTIDNLSDAVICAFFASQPNSPQLDNEDLQQIYPDDLEEMDLRWQMTMLIMRARRFLKNKGGIFCECYWSRLGLIKSSGGVLTAIKGGHFARECRAPRNQENRNRESTRRTVPVETTTSNDLISCDGLGNYDWSDHAEEVQLTLHLWPTLLQVLTLRKRISEKRTKNKAKNDKTGHGREEREKDKVKKSKSKSTKGRGEIKGQNYLLQVSPMIMWLISIIWNDAKVYLECVKLGFVLKAESKKMRKSMLKQEFLEFRISEAEGLHKGYDRMQKIISQLNQLKAKPEDEDINLKFLRALPSSWS